MSKVLFINNYKEGTGYSQAGIDFILALDAAGVDVVPRHINMINKSYPVPQRIIELEKKSAKGASINIQYTLPHFMSYNGNYRNIAMFDYETSGAVDNNWTMQLNLMDNVWVTNTEQRYACINMGVDWSKLSQVSHTVDITKYQQSYEPFDFPEIKDKFVFYFIGELSKRKNIESIVKAFHLEFHRGEDVELILKLNVPGLSGKEAQDQAHKYLGMVKEGMKIYHDPMRYKPEILITDRLADVDIMRLHATGDCFITTSHGEGWCKPAFDAMAMGKTPIVTASGGLREFITEKTGWPVEGYDDPVFGCDNGIPNLYTSNESWSRTNIYGIRRAMREAFTNKQLKESKGDAGIERALDFRYDKVGKKLRGLLNV